MIAKKALGAGFAGLLLLIATADGRIINDTPGADTGSMPRAGISITVRKGFLVLAAGQIGGMRGKQNFVVDTGTSPSILNARIWHEEAFGPVVAVVGFDTEEEAISLANDSEFGLGAAIWTRDLSQAFRISEQIDAGIVWVNTMQPCYVESPWGGYKQSGHGRELSLHGIEEFLETKQVHINLSERPIGWY